jgi:hypothetical protein
LPLRGNETSLIVFKDVWLLWSLENAKKNPVPGICITVLNKIGPRGGPNIFKNNNSVVPVAPERQNKSELL